jgi:hypothetical protein
MDWSGSPDAPQGGIPPELYVPCLVCVRSKDELEEFFATLRQEIGLARWEEFRGHRLRLRPGVLQRMVGYALENAHLIAFSFDKKALAAELGEQVFGNAALIAPATGLLAAHHCFEARPLKTLAYDAGDIGGERRKGFRTAVQREARGRWADGPDVRPLPSDKSSLVQFADVLAYAVQREEHGLSETAELGRQVRRLRRKSECLIRRGNGSDLQPYLSL